MQSVPFWGGEPLSSSPEANGEKELPTTVKDDAELARFTVDEHLSDIERTVLFLNGGQAVQQKHAIVNLPGLVRGRGRAAFEAVAQPLKSALNRLDAEAQIATAEAFATIASDRLLSGPEVQACLLPIVVRNINKEKSEEESAAWISALCEMIPLLDKEVLRTEVTSLATSKGDVEENVGSRVICAKILGALAPQLSREDIERGYLKKALKMCQDVDSLVRISMCQSLGPIARALGKDAAMKEVLPELLELLNDEEVQVQIAAYTTVASVIDILPPDVRKQRVLPTLLKHMQPMDLDISMQRCIAQLFGPILWLVRGELESDDAPVFYGCYKHMASKSDAELRRLCAAQFPAVLKAASSLNSHAFQTTFQDMFNNLVSDPNIDVRIAVAGQLHDVARQVGRDCPAVLTRPLVRLLRDEVQDVQAALLPMISATLQNWVLADESKRDASLGDVVKALLELESSIARTWRMQFHLASAFAGFTQVFSCDQIHDQFLPMAFRFLTNSAAAVRPAVAEGIAAFFRNSRREKQRGELYMRLVREFCRSKTYSVRASFAGIAGHLIRLFSARFTKEFVLDLVLELLYDAVPNVRLSVIGLLPPLKLRIKLPEDVDLLERLNNAMSNAMTDNDRDVSQVARAMNESFKRTPVRMMAGGNSMDAINGGLGALHFNETEDRRKEEEELDFTFAADDVKEIKAEIALLRRKGLVGRESMDALQASSSGSLKTINLSGATGTAGAAAGHARRVIAQQPASTNGPAGVTAGARLSPGSGLNAVRAGSNDSSAHATTHNSSPTTSSRTLLGTGSGSGGAHDRSNSHTLSSGTGRPGASPAPTTLGRAGSGHPDNGNSSSASSAGFSTSVAGAKAAPRPIVTARPAPSPSPSRPHQPSSPSSVSSPTSAASHASPVRLPQIGTKAAPGPATSPASTSGAVKSPLLRSSVGTASSSASKPASTGLAAVAAGAVARRKV